MKVLITGGAGFIGSHLAEELLKRGDSVTCIDDFSTGNRENIAHLEKEKNFTVIEDSILNRSRMAKLVAECDEIYHLAAAVGVKYILEESLKGIEINVKGTEIILELASLENKKVFIASTSEVYGKNPNPVFSEKSDCVLGSTQMTRWGYACAKALDEFLALAYFKKKGLQVVVGRFFNTVGPRQTGRYGMVIPRFVSNALANLPITVYGDGKQLRSFGYVGDVVGGVIDLMKHPEAVGEVFNLGNPRAISIEDLAKKIKDMTGSKSEIVYLPYDQAYGEGFEDMRHRVPDITKIHNLTGYTPRVGLEEILKKVIEHALASAVSTDASKPRRILIVDDEEDIRKILKGRLHQAGYEVLEAADGQEGVLRALDDRPHLILMDIMMPRLNGLEACKMIRGKVQTSSIPLIMLTAKGEKESELRGFDAGADDYMAKPFDMELLLARIRSLLKR